MTATIDTTDFTDKQKLIFLTTSVKSMSKIIRHLSYEVEELQEEKKELEKKLSRMEISRNSASEKNKEYRKMNRKLSEKLRKV